MRSIGPSSILLLSLFTASPASAQEPVELELVPWANLARAIDLDFDSEGRIYVARQMGNIDIVADSATVLAPSFLDISSRVVYSGERGLLGFALDPDYAQNGHFYINYVHPSGPFGTSRISRFTRDVTDPNRADPASEVVLIALEQPNAIHQAGGLAFGPDGYLYCALGDGGGADDPNDYGQDPTTLFGTVLRIKPEADGTYSIPPDNPFAGSPNGERPEIWAYGLRNPFRIGIDPLNGDLWIAAVGPQRWEEIDRWPGGLNTGPNFGWRCYEGGEEFNLSTCLPEAEHVFPVAVKGHPVTGGDFCAIIGGEVYRGGLWPRFQGRYFYSDYCVGGIWTLTPDGLGGYTDQLAAPMAFTGNSAFAVKPTGEFFMTNATQGRLFQLRDRCPMDRPVITPDGNELIAPEGASYAWFVDGVAFPDGDTQVIYAYLTGNYTVRVTYANGCIKESEPYFHLSTGTRGTVAEGLRISPNPTDGLLEVGLPSVWTHADVLVTDLCGKACKASMQVSRTGAFQLDARGLVPGTYLLSVSDGRSAPRRARFVVAR